MILDGNLIFTGTSGGASGGITLGAQTDRPTTGAQDASNIVDLGVASGIPTSANGAGARDIGIGDDPAMKLLAVCTTSFTGGTSTILSLSGAPDDGTATNTPGSYTVMWTSPTYLLASLIAGAQLANVDVPRVIAGQVLPRFLKLSYTSAGPLTGGSIEAGIVLDRFDQVEQTNAVLGGYPPGVVIAN